MHRHVPRATILSIHVTLGLLEARMIRLNPQPVIELSCRRRRSVFWEWGGFLGLF